MGKWASQCSGWHVEYVLTIGAGYAESGSRCAGVPVRAAATQAFPVTLASSPKESYPGFAIVVFCFWRLNWEKPCGGFDGLLMRLIKET
jgi:hypothetical protein